MTATVSPESMAFSPQSFGLLLNNFSFAVSDSMGKLPIHVL
jgi:hypothetical protein